MNFNIHTGLYSNRAAEIIKIMLKRLNGEHFYSSRKDRNAADSFVETAPDGEVIIKNDYSEYCVSFGKCKTLQTQCDWISWRLKVVAFKSLELSGDKDHNNWKRTNTDVVHYYKPLQYEHSLTVTKPITYAEIYCLYEILRNHKNIERKYDASMIEELRGTIRDPFATQMEANRRDEEARLIDEMNCEIARLQREREDEITAASARVITKYRELVANVKEKCNASIKTLNETFAEALKLSSDN